MAWVKPVSAGVTQTLVSRSTGPGFRGGDDVSHGYALRVGPRGDVSWEVDDPSSMVPEWLTVPVTELFDGGWHHVAAAWSPGSMAVFIDGVEVARQVSRSGSINPATSTAFMIGGEQGTPFGYRGSIDEVMVFNRAIAAAEIAGCVPPPPTITTFAGGGVGDGGPAVNAAVNNPSAVAVDTAGNLYITDSGNNRVRKVSTSGTITTVAGNGTPGFSGDGGPAADASLNNPSAVAVDSAGNLYIADAHNHRVRKVSVSGTITTIAGTGGFGYSGDGGSATSAELYFPQGVAVDAAGNLFIADTNNDRVRKVSVSGTITTVAGNGSSGDGGPAIDASLSFPQGVVVDAAGNLYIADTSNHRVRKVSVSGTITTIAGVGSSGYSGDGGSAIDATVFFPRGVAVDAAGNLFIADTSNHRVRKVSVSGTITTVAGNGSSGDGGPAIDASLSFPQGVVVDAAGNLYIADINNHRVRKVSVSGTITTVAGNGTPGFSGDGGPATKAGLP
jgi:sugar lactone lactonase YvrE